MLAETLCDLEREAVRDIGTEAETVAVTVADTDRERLVLGETVSVEDRDWARDRDDDGDSVSVADRDTVRVSEVDADAERLQETLAVRELETERDTLGEAALLAERVDVALTLPETLAERDELAALLADTLRDAVTETDASDAFVPLTEALLVMLAVRDVDAALDGVNVALGVKVDKPELVLDPDFEADADTDALKEVLALGEKDGDGSGVPGVQKVVLLGVRDAGSERDGDLDAAIELEALTDRDDDTLRDALREFDVDLEPA